MASLSDYSVTPSGSVQPTVPDTVVAGKVLSDDGLTLIADYTGVNAKHFPGDLAALDQDTRDALLSNVYQSFLLAFAGQFP